MPIEIHSKPLANCLWFFAGCVQFLAVLLVFIGLGWVRGDLTAMLHHPVAFIIGVAAYYGLLRWYCK